MSVNRIYLANNDTSVIVVNKNKLQIFNTIHDTKKEKLTVIFSSPYAVELLIK